MNNVLILDVVKTLIAVSIFFVWVVRYENIVKEFKQYKLSNSIRDFVGILKLSFALMLMSPKVELQMIASIGFIVLMIAALFTHIKIKNPKINMAPAFSLLVLNIYISSSLV